MNINEFFNKIPKWTKESLNSLIELSTHYTNRFKYCTVDLAGINEKEIGYYYLNDLYEYNTIYKSKSSIEIANYIMRNLDICG